MYGQLYYVNKTEIMIKYIRVKKPKLAKFNNNMLESQKLKLVKTIILRCNSDQGL
jgi:hypothetical protein